MRVGAVADEEQGTLRECLMCTALLCLATRPACGSGLSGIRIYLEQIQWIPYAPRTLRLTSECDVRWRELWSGGSPKARWAICNVFL